MRFGSLDIADSERLDKERGWYVDYDRGWLISAAVLEVINDG